MGSHRQLKEEESEKPILDSDSVYEAVEDFNFLALHQLWCYKYRKAICLLRFLICAQERCDDQQTAPPLAGTLSKSSDGTRPEKADGNCCRTKPHPSTPAQESTRRSGKQNAKAEECLIVFRLAHLSSTFLPPRSSG